MSMFRNLMLASLRNRRRVTGFVGGWKAYGRSNTEDASTRDILPDYSGNGRDIRLYNFDFTESSGYSGGGLVSDGVDDYGQCVKGFSLPDDYTVVAIRKVISSNNAAIASKGATVGAFLFDATSGGTHVNAWSYGSQNPLNNFPALFSYQTKASYNGTAISFGKQEDSESDLLKLFTHNNSSCAQAVLYDLRIYDHSLTAEELQTVKDEMMADYEKATGGGIADIHYVADWDGKGRSNDEDEPMRSTWTDRATGKVIDLHNYAYAGMSGWGGYGTDMSKTIPHNDIAVTETTVMSLKCTSILKKSNSPITEWGPNVIASGPTTVRFRIAGVSDNLSIRFESYTIEKGLKTLFTATSDGEYTVEISDPAKYYRWIAILPADAVYPVNCDITIEQLPLYPGALVSDGVDDYGKTREALAEEVGTVLIHMADINPKSLAFYYNIPTPNNNEPGRLYFYSYGTSLTPYAGNPSMNMGHDPIRIFRRSPIVTPELPLYIFTAIENTLYQNYALYRLILIREQLNDEQVEFLKWKVEKEYRDWCKANGYEYAINQLTA